MRRCLLLCILSFFFLAPGIAQTALQTNRAELEKQREEIQREIQAVKESLDQTKKNRKESLGQLALLQRKLRLRESAIRNVNKQIDYIQSDIGESRTEITKLKRTWIHLKYSTKKVSSMLTRTGATTIF